MEESGDFSLGGDQELDDSDWKLGGGGGSRRRPLAAGSCAGVIGACQHRSLYGRPCRQLSEQLVAGPGSSCYRQLTDLHELKMIQSSLTEQVCEIPSTAKSTFLMVFSGDGKRMASTHGDHNIYITDTSSGQLITTLHGHPRTPWCVVFHPTNQHLVASGCLGGEVRVWDQTGGSERWQSHDCRVIASLAFHPVDHVLAIATGNDLYFWNWKTREPFVQCNTLHPRERLRYVKFDSYGHKLLTAISNVSSTEPGASSGSGTSNVSGPGAEWSASRYGSSSNLSGWLSRRQEGGRRNYLDSVYQSLMRRYEQLQAQYLALRLRRRQTEEINYRAVVNGSYSSQPSADSVTETDSPNRNTHSSPGVLRASPPLSPPPPIPPPPPPPQPSDQLQERGTAVGGGSSLSEGVAAAQAYADSVTRQHRVSRRRQDMSETRFVLGWAQTVIDTLIEAIGQMLESSHSQSSANLTGPPAFVAPELQHSGALLASSLADMATHLQLNPGAASGTMNPGAGPTLAPLGSESLQDIAGINSLIRTQLVDMTRILLDSQIRQRVLSGVSSLSDSLLAELRVLRRLLCAVREQCCSLCALLDSGSARTEPGPGPGDRPGPSAPSTGMSLLARRHLMRRTLRRQQYRRNPRRLSVSDVTVQTVAPSSGVDSDSVSNSSDESSVGVSRSAFSSFSRLRDPLHVRSLTRPSRSLLALRRSQSRSNLLRGDGALRRSHSIIGLDRRHIRSSLLRQSSSDREDVSMETSQRDDNETSPMTSSANAAAAGGGSPLSSTNTAPDSLMQTSSVSAVSSRLSTPARFSRRLSLLLERVTSTVPSPSVSDASEEIPLQSLVSSPTTIGSDRPGLDISPIVASSNDAVASLTVSSGGVSASRSSSSPVVVRSMSGRLPRSSLLATLPRTLSSSRDFNLIASNDLGPLLSQERTSSDVLRSATSINSPILSVAQHSSAGSSFSASGNVLASTGRLVLDSVRITSSGTNSFSVASPFSFATTVSSLTTASPVSTSSSSFNLPGSAPGALGLEVPVSVWALSQGSTVSSSSNGSVSTTPTSFQTSSRYIYLAGSGSSVLPSPRSLSLTSSGTLISASSASLASFISSPLYSFGPISTTSSTSSVSTSSCPWTSTSSTWSSSSITSATLTPRTRESGIAASSVFSAPESEPIVRVRQHRTLLSPRSVSSPYDRISSVHRIATRHRDSRSSAMMVGVAAVSSAAASSSPSTTADDTLPSNHRRLDMLVRAARLLEQDSGSALTPSSSTSDLQSAHSRPISSSSAVESRSELPSDSGQSTEAAAAPYPPHLSPFLALPQRSVSAVRRVARAPLRPRDVMLGARDPFLGAGGIDTDDSLEEDTVGFVRQRPRASAAVGAENVFPGGAGARAAGRERAVPLEDIGSLFIGGEGLPFGVAGGGYDSFFQVLCSGHPHVTHRLQAWDFSQLQIPDISNDRVNMVSDRCKIHNDAAVDISRDATCVVTVVREPPTTSVCVFSLVTKHLGRLLYRVPLSVNIVSVSLSLNARFLVVGLAARRMMALSSDSQVMAQVFRLNAASGQAVVVKSLMLNNSPMSSRYSSINCIRFLPEVGAGFVYGTNRGRLVMLKA